MSVSDVRHLLPALAALALLACGAEGEPTSSVPVDVSATAAGQAELFTPHFDPAEASESQFELPEGRRTLRDVDPQARPIERWRRRVEDPNAGSGMPMSDELPRSAGAADGSCAARCGDDPMCRLMCAAGEVPEHDGFEEGEQAEPIDGEAEDLCLVCGRETGFLGAPDELRGEADGGSVTLEWAAVEGADKYAVHGMRVRDGGRAALVEQSYVWFTEATTLTVDLETGFSYTFYVVAWDDEGKTRSAASRPLRIDL